MRMIAALVFSFATPALADHTPEPELAPAMNHADHCGLPSGEGAIAALDVAKARVAIAHEPVARFFDAQAGVRHDFVRGADRTFGVVGVQGLAPYWFEIDAAIFISGDGDVSARLEAEYDLLLTQRLILQPRTEVNVAVQSVEEIGVGAGLSTAEIGARLRYEYTRQIAPYIGVSWERSVGETADFARAGGENVGAVSAVGGVKLWF